MTTNGLDTVADQLKVAADQYGAEAAELEVQAKTLRDKQARLRAAVAAMEGTKRAYRRFTPEEDAILRADWGRASVNQIATRLGRCWDAVAGRGRILGLTQ